MSFYTRSRKSEKSEKFQEVMVADCACRGVAIGGTRFREKRLATVPARRTGSWGGGGGGATVRETRKRVDASTPIQVNMPIFGVYIQR